MFCDDTFILIHEIICVSIPILITTGDILTKLHRPNCKSFAKVSTLNGGIRNSICSCLPTHTSGQV